MEEYTYIGDVSSHQSIPGYPLLVGLYSEDKNPALVTAQGTLANYIYDLSCTDYEEKYMLKRFTFSSWCSLIRVEVLDQDGQVLKAVEEGSDYSNFIE